MSLLSTKTLICIVLIGMPLVAMCDDYYLTVAFRQCGGTVTINGIPSAENRSNTHGYYSTSLCITNLLVNGKNHVNIAYCPYATSDEQSTIRWSIKRTPDGEPMQSATTKTVLEEQLGSRTLKLAALSEADITTCAGTLDDQHRIHFSSDGDAAIWGGADLVKSVHLSVCRLF